jgi:hypothetical protein
MMWSPSLLAVVLLSVLAASVAQAKPHILLMV